MRLMRWSAGWCSGGGGKVEIGTYRLSREEECNPARRGQRSDRRNDGWSESGMERAVSAHEIRNMLAE